MRPSPLFVAALCGVGSLAQQSTLISSTSSAGALQTSAPGVISPNYVLTGFEGCNPDTQIPQIKSGFSDMITMLMADQFGNYPTVDWNSGPAQDYWGSYDKNGRLRVEITNNLNRAAAVTYQWWINPFAKRLHARCDDPLKECTCLPDQGVVDAYTINHDPHINFCPGYFSRPNLQTALENPVQGQWEYIAAFHNQAAIWSHEIMHVAQIGHAASPIDGFIIDQPVKGWPGISYRPGSPYNTGSYGDWFTKWLAQSPGSFITDLIDNADNYALFYLSNYIVKKLGYYPSRRQVPISPRTINGLSADPNATVEYLGTSPYNTNNYCYSNRYY